MAYRSLFNLRVIKRNVGLIKWGDLVSSRGGLNSPCILHASSWCAGKEPAAPHPSEEVLK